MRKKKMEGGVGDSPLANMEPSKRSREPPRRNWAPFFKWLVVLSLVFSFAGMNMKYGKAPFLERYYAPTEVRVLDGVLDTAHTIANNAVVIVEHINSVINKIVRSLAIMRHNLMPYLVTGLALVMIIIEFFRSGFKLRKYIRESSTECHYWKRWATGLVIATPFLIAMLYHGANSMMWMYGDIMS
jgi:hypothetical protein